MKARVINIKGIDKDIYRLGLGSMIFAPRMKMLAFELLDAFVERGGNLIDTAEIYGVPEQYGLAEITIGRWLSSRQNRDRLVIVTKGCIPGTCAPLYDGRLSEISASGVRRAIQGSLERLQIDYIDLWMLHRDDPSVPVEVLIDALNEEVERGHIKAFGASNWTATRIVEANTYAELYGLKGFVASSIQFSLAQANVPYWPGTVHMTPTEISWYKENKFPLLAWSALARGFFSGRVDPDAPYDPAINPDLVRTYYSKDNFERLRRARELGKKKGLTAAEIALAYLVNQPFPVVPLVMPQNPEQLESCFKGVEVTLSKEEVAWLNLEVQTL